MSKPARTAHSGTFFTTTITHSRRRIFQVAAEADLLFEVLQHYRQEGSYKLHAFVIMPDHLHLLLTTDDLPTSMRHIKGGFSHRLGSPYPVWQRGYTDHLVLSRTDFEVRRTYLHENPVRAGLSASIDQYRWSSAYKAPTRG